MVNSQALCLSDVQSYSIFRYDEMQLVRLVIIR